MPNNFQEIINRVIYSKSIDDASNILYGKDGLNIDYHSYYEKLIASFGMKVQTLIIKNGNILNFDIEKNKKELWNIVFIGQLLYEKILDEYNKKLNDSTITKEESENILKNIRNFKDRIDEANIIIPININLSSSQIDEFKMSITIIQKIKDSTMHINSNNKYEFDFENKVLIISNDGGRFNLPKIEIPIEYIEGFVNSFIVPKQIDNDKAKDVDNFIYPVLQSLDFDPKNLTNFFYRVDPDKLDYLLSVLGNDTSLLYKLNPFVFNCSVQFIKSLLDNYGNNIDILCKLPNNAFVFEKTTINYLKIFGVKKLFQLPDKAFEKPELINEMIKKFGITILDELNSWEIFKDVETQIHSFYNYVGYSYIEGFIELSNKYPKEVIKNFPLHAYKFYSVTEDIIKNNNNGIELVMVLPEVAFENLRHIKINYTTIIGISGSSEIPEYTNMQRLIRKYNIDVIKKIPEYAFKYPGAILYILEYYGSENLDVLPIECFINPYSTASVLKYMKKEDSNFSRKVLSRILKHSKYPKSFDFYINKYGVEKAILLLDNTPEWGLKHFYKASKLIDKYGIDVIKKIPNIALETTRLKKNTVLGDTITGDVKFPKGTLSFLKKYENSLEKFPKTFFLYPKGTDYLLSFYNIDLILDLPFYAFRESKKTKILIDKYGVDIINALPEFVFLDNNNLDCIDNVVQLVSGDIKKLKELPSEFFRCHDKEILDRLYNNYNRVITQSIFNTKNPKIIALIIYAKDILSQWDYSVINSNKNLRIKLSNINFKELNLSELEHYIELDTIQNKLDGNKKFPIDNKYCNMLNGIINNAKEQVIATKRSEFESNIRDKIGLYLNNEIIRPLRNAESHFRFVDVYDNDGQIISDKVRVFDVNENGVITHDRVYNIKIIFEFIKQIDLFMKGEIVNKSFQSVFDELNTDNMPLTSAIENYIPIINEVENEHFKNKN